MVLTIGKWQFTLLGNTARVILKTEKNEFSVAVNWDGKPDGVVRIDGYLNHELVFVHDIDMGAKNG